MKLGLCWVAIVGCAGCGLGLGGDAFTVGSALAIDAGASADGAAIERPPGDDAGDARKIGHHVGDGDAADDAVTVEAGGALDQGAGDPPRLDAGEPAHDAGELVDEAPPPPPPPPPLCCATPCQGASVAAIACGNGPDWTCSAGSCGARACAVGDVCDWMGASCVGRVEVCP